MKKLFLIILITSTIQQLFAQTVPGPVEQRVTDSLCNCVTRLDRSKIKNKEEAVQAYTNCVMKNADLLPDLATERKVDMTDQSAMRLVGVDLGKNLMKQKCTGFIELSAAMAKNTALEIADAVTGTFKRIDVKGFNYIVIAADGAEKSFLWLRQFPGSEKFIDAGKTLAGKKLRITSKEIEVYLPLVKGYYKVKEITGIEVL